MNININNIIRSTTFKIVLMTLPIGGVGGGLLSSCSDSWDDHYTSSQENVSEGTLWEALQSNQNLSNFTSVLKACGYDTQLSGSQTYTVFAPTNDCFSSTDAQELISAYNEQKSSGVKDDDNTTIRQFVQNHIAMYRHSVSTLTNDSIALLNGKYKVLNDSILGNSKLTTSNKAVANGVLFTISDRVDYFPNIYEYLKMDTELDSIYTFLSQFDDYEFQPGLSVAGSINADGETEYLDSVSTFSNSMLSNLGYINREDSTYWLVAPTNSEWAKLYNEYHQYFKYSTNVAKADSLQEAMTHKAIIEGAFFNRTTNPDKAFQDSAISTLAQSSYAMRHAAGEDDRYVYYQPFAAGGIFNGATQVECSNGKLLKAADYRIDKSKTFCREIKIEAENMNYQDTLVMCESPLTIQTVTSDNPFYDKVSNNQYVDIIAKNTSTDPTKWPQPQIRFSIPNTLSNIPYDIYVVTAPVEAGNKNASADDKLPNKFSGTIYYYDEKNALKQKRISAKTTQSGVVDSILVGSNITFPASAYGLTSNIVRIQLISQVARNATAQFSNALHIDCIILKPKEQ